MEFKGTKGKWHWNETGGQCYNMPELVNENNEFVLGFGDDTTYYPTEGTPPNEYDALLISKAPEMLEMLKVARDKFLDLKYEHDSSLKDIQWEIEELIKQATEL